jgi:glutamyl-tRNA reductase
MMLQMVGCNHQDSSLEFREQLAFNPDQVQDALVQLRELYPLSELVLLSTCNRVELYSAAVEGSNCPGKDEVASFFSDFHEIDVEAVGGQIQLYEGDGAVRHLFATAASMESMVVGEAQVLSQVKQAYQAANLANCTGPLTHAAFQAAMHVAKRVATETAINQKRVSIPSVAVGDFASRFFERFDDKNVLVIGAGEMGEETLRYLIDQQVTTINIINRDQARAEQLAARTAGTARPWEELDDLLIVADLVVSTTGAQQPVVTRERFDAISHQRFQRPLFILDLAVPRDFEPSIGDCLAIYLYSLDDLQQVCEENKRSREQEWPRAEQILDEEMASFIAENNRRSSGPWIRQLREQAEKTKREELKRLLNKIGGEPDPQLKAELEVAFDRLVNKLLHPSLESLRNGAALGDQHKLLDTLKQLFKLKD